MILGTGWKIDEKTVITASNQDAYKAPLDDCKTLIPSVTKMGVDPGGYPVYAPPIGWTVITATKDNAGEIDLDIIWVSPGGVGTSIVSCAGGSLSTSSLTPQFEVTRVGGGGSGILLAAAAAGLLAWLLMRE